MILVKRLFVSFVGWLAFQSTYVALAQFINELAFRRSPVESIAANLPEAVQYAAVIAIAFLSGYFAYTVSIIGFVAPLAMWSRLIVQRLRIALFSDWLVFFILWFIISFLLNMFAPVLTHTSTSGSLEIPLGSIGSIAVGAWLYFKTVLLFTSAQFDPPVRELGESVAD